MADVTVCRHQRRAAQTLLDEALAVAHEGWPLVRRLGFRDWLTEPSEPLRVILGQAGEDVGHWHRHRVPQLLAQWREHPGPR